jgi:hypothetical protein
MTADWQPGDTLPDAQRANPWPHRAGWFQLENAFTTHECAFPECPRVERGWPEVFPWHDVEGAA